MTKKERKEEEKQETRGEGGEDGGGGKEETGEKGKEYRTIWQTVKYYLKQGSQPYYI